MSKCKSLYIRRKKFCRWFLYSVELAEALTSILSIQSDLFWGIFYGMDSWHYFRSHGLQSSILTVSIKGFWRGKWVALEDKSSQYSWPEARTSERKWSSTFSTVTAPQRGPEGLLGIHMHRQRVWLLSSFVPGLALRILITRLLLLLWWTMQYYFKWSISGCQLFMSCSCRP